MAVDLGALGGTYTTGGDANSIRMIKAFGEVANAGSGVGQLGCDGRPVLTTFREFEDSCNHLHLEVTPEQQALIDEYAEIIPYLSTSPLVTVVACPACGRYGLQDRRTAGTRCIFTMRCPGKSVKGSSTPKAQPKPKAQSPIEPAPDDDSDDVPNPADPAIAETAPTTDGDGLFD